MKLNKIHAVAAILAALVYIAGCTNPGASSDKAGDGSTSSTSGGNTTGQSVSSRDFKEAADIWGRVLAAKSAFDDVVKDGKWNAVHEAAFAIRDEVFLLPDASGALGDHLAMLREDVKAVASLASALDEAGDAGKGDEVAALAKEMDAALERIAGHYPHGVLPERATTTAVLPDPGSDHGH